MKKIPFNDKLGLNQAVLDGWKTMTRRICKYDRPDDTYDIVFPVFEPSDYGNDGNIVSPLNYAFGWRNDKGDFTGWNIPKYKVGEVVAIAQSYKTINEFYEIAYKRHNSFHGQIVTKYDIPFKEIVKWFNLRESLKDTAGWTNKMFVKADLMISHIRITNVKIERLQDISDDECLREGVEFSKERYDYDGTKSYFVQGIKEIGNRFMRMFYKHFDTPREAFAALIDKVSGKGAWNSNPYVFAYEFELID